MKRGLIVGIIIVVLIAIFLFSSQILLKTEKDLDNNVGSQENAEETPETQETQRIVCTREFSPSYSDNEYYTGDLFDAHFHMPLLVDFSEIEEYGIDHGTDSNIDPVLGKDVFLDDMLCLLEKEGVRGIIGFSILVDEALQETINKADSINLETSGKINLFLMSMDFNSEKLNSIQQTNPGIFVGYGEIAFYLPNLRTQSPDNQNFMKIYEIAGNNNLVVMMHPDARQEAKIENAIKANPNTKFLLHGPEIENTIIGMISKYPNVYYSIDAILIRAPRNPGGLIYTTNNVQEMKSSFDQNYDGMMRDAVGKWKSRIEQYPDRFMWGTDRAYKWHYGGDVSILLEEFGRGFIAKLDPSVQEKFAYQNAESLLGK